MLFSELTLQRSVKAMVGVSVAGVFVNLSILLIHQRHSVESTASAMTMLATSLMEKYVEVSLTESVTSLRPVYYGSYCVKSSVFSTS